MFFDVTVLLYSVVCTQSLLSKLDINNSDELKQFLGYESDPSIAFAWPCGPKSLPRIDKVCSFLF